MGIKKVSFYELSVGPNKSLDVKPIPILFNPAIERWALSVALTSLTTPVDSTTTSPEVHDVSVGAIVTTHRHPNGVTVTHATSEQYGRLTSLKLAILELYGVKVGAVLTLYEYDDLIVEFPTERSGLER